jgi:hypothetical protein
VRLGWVLSPIGLALGLLGLLLVIREWQPRFLFPVLTAATLSAFYFYKIRVFNDYPFAFRRFVPLVAPFLLALASFFLVRLAARGRLRRGVAALLVAGLAGIYVKDTRVIFDHVDWRGSVRFVREVARRFGPDDIVVFEQPRSIHLLSLPLWAAHGVNILELARFNPDPDRLQHLIESWRPRFRNIYFVHTYRTELCSLFLRRVGFFSFATFEWYAYNKRPGPPEFRSLHFEVSRVVPPEELQVPPLPEIDIGNFDDFQVSGFFDKEGDPNFNYRWTGPCASVYLPGVHAGETLTITAAVEHRPDAPLVTASLSGMPLGDFVVGSQWKRHVLSLPDELPPGPPVLRLDMPAWRPINVLPDSDDTRDLGIMVDRISIGAGADEAQARER